MSPIPGRNAGRSSSPMSMFKHGEVVDKPSHPNELILEAWAMGYLVGSLVIMAFITVANMRRGVLLHKLILIELVLGIWQGFWLFFDKPVYAWWLSIGAIFLNASWSLHNVIAWMKIKPFLSRPVSLIFIGTVILAQPYWILEIYANFSYFHGHTKLFEKTRPFEALCRDPWWIFTTVMLFWTIKTQYEITLKEIMRISPRFGIMLGAMVLSIIFIALDICSVTGAFSSGLPVGINPFWKLAFVFKSLTDSVVLDDFKMALDRLRAFKISRLGSFSQDTSDRRTHNNGSLVNTWEALEREAKRKPLPSPDGDYVHASNFPGFSHHRRRKEDKDPILPPDQAYLRSQNNSLNPEDLVPSSLGPFRSASTAAKASPSPSGKNRDDNDDLAALDFGHLTAESDYGHALRELESHSQPSSPSKTSFRRQSQPP
ncbi:hypothetical protein BDV95DRAFT_589233 [Massariosphaeria phaeospora]|uniref:Uncharacterized protein n=1 Tax=Massariosphaeria phaeospora TaxID=100035 RepID=A0A7C8IFE2_9PLEO|nr:hypothetical protein BDV95DRAFT_589233 [Massariosphaeria phaeospora]